MINIKPISFRKDHFQVNPEKRFDRIKRSIESLPNHHIYGYIDDIKGNSVGKTFHYTLPAVLPTYIYLDITV